MEERIILHIDMDAFYASVEQRDNPSLLGKPIVVGEDSLRSVVSTASYEARRYGISSAMPMVKAKKMCPNLIIVPHRFDVYKAVSAQIHGIFKQYTQQVEPISLDEAFLDITHYERNGRDVREIAQEIKDKIYEATGLTASAGVSYNKFLAKIASDYEKPNGLFYVSKEEAFNFISALPIDKFWGVGRKTATEMRKMGIFTGRELRKMSLNHLTDVFGKVGKLYYDFARGIDARTVETNHERKSVGCETTLMADIVTFSGVLIEVYHLIIKLEQRINKAQFEGRTLTLKVKYANFRQVTRSITHDEVLRTKAQLLPLVKKLIKQINISLEGIRLLGVSVSNMNVIDKEKKKEEETELLLPFDD